MLSRKSRFALAVVAAAVLVAAMAIAVTGNGYIECRNPSESATDCFNEFVHGAGFADEPARSIGPEILIGLSTLSATVLLVLTALELRRRFRTKRGT